ncbi:MAG: amidohydrolase family protein [bacterium]
MSKTLIKNGCIISVDPGVGDLPDGDILIEEDRIEEIGTGLQAPGAEILDASGMIVLPGLINAHLHTWETPVRGIGGDWGGFDYFRHLHANLAPRFTPEDTRLGNMMGALSQLDGGTTTIFDWCHNNATPDHTDAALDGLADAGIRALFGHGSVKPEPKEGEKHFSQIPHSREEIKRLREGRLSDDGALVTLAVSILGTDYGTLDVALHDFRLAREFGLISSAHIWGAPDRLVEDGYRVLAKEGLLGPDHNLVHGNYLGDEELRFILDAGVSVTATPQAELQTNRGEPLTGRVLAMGGRPSIGSDIEIYSTGDMFHVMRFALLSQRIFDNQKIGGDRPRADKISVRARQALEWVTINNAAAMGLEDRIGSLAPGKQADIIMIRSGDMNLMPAHDPVHTAVLHAHGGNVDTVLVAGKKVKAGGRLRIPEADLERKKEALRETGRRLLREAGL